MHHFLPKRKCIGDTLTENVISFKIINYSKLRKEPELLGSRASNMCSVRIRMFDSTSKSVRSRMLNLNYIYIYIYAFIFTHLFIQTYSLSQCKHIRE